ncbi:MAG: hypothetical protein ACMG6E_04675, partial [Candidatus Roizmanbacteria bacterium]
DVYQKTIAAENEKHSDPKLNKKGQNFKVRSRQALQSIYLKPGTKGKIRAVGVGFDYIPRSDRNAEPYKDGYVESDPLPRIKSDADAPKRAKSITKFKFRYQSQFAKMFKPIFNDLGILGLEPRPVMLQMTDEVPKSRLEVVRRMSAKSAKIIEIVHYDIKVPGEHEVTYCYNIWLRDGGGILVGMCFEFVGYQRFTAEAKTKVVNLTDQARFAYMTGPPASTAASNSTIKDIVNSSENIYANKIALVIASDVAAVGISFMNVRKFIHTGPTFQLIEQPRGRTRRANSHRDFPRDEQKFVKTYLLAATGPKGEQTVDHSIWWSVQEKSEPINMVKKALQRLSIDCIFKKGKEVNGPSLLASEHCVGSDGKKLVVGEIDYTTYHLHWAQVEYDIIEQKIRSFFLLTPNLWRYHCCY